VNAALEKQNHGARVDHRSYERQGVEQLPTVHLGVAASRMERKGIRTELGDRNRAIAVTNQELRQLRARLNKVTNWLYAQPLADAPTLIDMMNGAAGGERLNSRWRKIAALQTQANVLVFLQQNGVASVERLGETVTQMHRQLYDLANTVKSAERRLTTLKQHLTQADIRKRHMAVYKKYRQLDPKKRGAYAEKHGEEIEKYEAAARYLKDHLNGREKIPEKEWRAEYDSLLTERYANVEKYYKLKDDVRNVEILRRSAEKMMAETAPEQTSQPRDMAR
jgi:hypothetical protein